MSPKMTESDLLQDKKKSSTDSKDNTDNLDNDIEQNQLQASSQSNHNHSNAQDNALQVKPAAEETSNVKLTNQNQQTNFDASLLASNRNVNSENQLNEINEINKNNLKNSRSASTNKVWLLFILFLMFLLIGLGVYFGYQINQRINQIDKQAQLVLNNESQQNNRWQKHFVQTNENMQQVKKLTSEENEKVKNSLSLQQQKLDGLQNELSDMAQNYHSLVADRQNITLLAAQELFDLTQQQWALNKNAKTALSSMNLIVEKIKPIDTVAARTLKQTLDAEITRLKQLPVLDIAGITQQLDEAMSIIRSLPWSEHKLVDSHSNKLAGSQPNFIDSDLNALDKQKNFHDDEKLIAAHAQWSRRWYEQLKIFFSSAGHTAYQALGNVVKIQRIDLPNAAHLPLNANEKVIFLNQLQLHLLIAKLALLQHDGELLNNELNLLVQQINDHFEQSSADTKKLLSVVQEIQISVVPALKVMQKSLLTAKPDNMYINQNNTQSANFNLTGSDSAKPDSVKSNQPYVSNSNHVSSQAQQIDQPLKQNVGEN